MIQICIGYDPRESATFHVLEQSIIDRTSSPVCIIPLAKQSLRGFNGQKDGTNAFTYSRFLVPELMDFQGWAIFIVCLLILLIEVRLLSYLISGRPKLFDLFTLSSAPSRRLGSYARTNA